MGSLEATLNERFCYSAHVHDGRLERTEVIVCAASLGMAGEQ